MLTANEKNFYNQLIKESKAELDALNIKYCDNITWTTFNSTNTLGQCKYRGYKKYCTISINEALIKSGDAYNIKDTIIHELLHSCKDTKGHTGKWKQYAKIVNDAYGYNIKRCADSQDMQDIGIMEFVDYKYKVVCDKCGAISLYKRANKFIKRQGVGYYCGKCKGENFTAFISNDKILFSKKSFNF